MAMSISSLCRAAIKCAESFIDKDNLYCGSVKNSAAMGSGYSTMRVYSLATPSVPVLIVTKLLPAVRGYKHVISIESV